jgi:hypothetical protein
MRSRCRIGSAEKSVLQGLKDRGGTWCTKDGAIWDSLHWTARILESLAVKGLVDELEPDKKYRINKAGDKALAVTVFPQQAVLSETGYVNSPLQSRLRGIPAPKGRR